MAPTKNVVQLLGEFTWPAGQAVSPAFNLSDKLDDAQIGQFGVRALQIQSPDSLTNASAKLQSGRRFDTDGNPIGSADTDWVDMQSPDGDDIELEANKGIFLAAFPIPVIRLKGTVNEDSARVFRVFAQVQ